jgi:hypothetical protein
MATFMHIAIVALANGNSAISLVHWDAAYSLVRKSKVDNEVLVTPPLEPNDEHAQGDLDVERMGGSRTNSSNSSMSSREEQREEHKHMLSLISAIGRQVSYLTFSRLQGD